MLQPGDTAPNFTATTTDGTTITLADFAGSSNVVMFFYPADDTSGCTREACEFRDAYREFESVDTVVFGVSTNNQESHQAFTSKYDLNFPLLVDTEGAICALYDVPVDDGEAWRVTFLIGKDGLIKYAWENVRPSGHAAEVYEAIQTLLVP